MHTQTQQSSHSNGMVVMLFITFWLAWIGLEAMMKSEISSAVRNEKANRVLPEVQDFNQIAWEKVGWSTYYKRSKNIRQNIRIQSNNNSRYFYAQPACRSAVSMTSKHILNHRGAKNRKKRVGRLIFWPWRSCHDPEVWGSSLRHSNE